MYTVDTLIDWYRQHAAGLRVAREAQRELLVQRPVRPKLDDLEALTTRRCSSVPPRSYPDDGSAV
jgi:hypothetical protein